MKSLCLAAIFCSVLYQDVQGQDLGSLGHQAPVRLGGGLSLRNIFYNAKGIPPRNPSSAFVAAGDLQLDLYGIMLPFSFSYSNDGNSSVSQPFNQFGISPTYKWVTVHAGYRNLNLNPFTLSGHTILGAGVEINPGKWHGLFMYGRFNRATTIDTLSGSLVNAAYGRKGYAGKLGYGDQKNFIEFSFLRAQDDTNSLKVNKGAVDSLGGPNLTAAQNVVVGLSFRKSFLKNLFVESDGAFSIYTRDLQSPLAVGDGGSHFLEQVNKVIHINGTSDYSTALRSAVGYHYRTFTAKLEYRRIDPNFQSMGTYFLTTDISNYTVATSFAALKNRLRFSGNIGFQQDNLSHLKASTSSRVISAATLSADFTQHLGLDVNFSNYSTNQAPNTVKLADTLKITQTTYNLSATPRLIWANTQLTHMVIINGTYTVLNDFNTSYVPGQQSRQMNFYNYIFNYTIRFNKANAGLGTSVNYTDLKNASADDINYGVGLNGDKGFYKGMITARVNVNYLTDKRNGGEGNVINGNAQLSWRVAKHHSLGVNSYYLNNRPKAGNTTGLPLYTEWRNEVFYNFQL